MNILTAKEISIRLKKSLKFVYANASELEGTKIGGSWIFTQEGFENAIQIGKKLEGKGNLQRPEIYEPFQIKKGRTKMGKRQTKETKESRKALAERAGLAHCYEGLLHLFCRIPKRLI